MGEMTLFPTDPPTGTSISDLVRFGTSTWTYEGWQGQVYKRQYGKTTFARDCWKSAASPHVYNHWTVVVHMNAGYGRVVSPTGDDLNQL